MKGASLLSEAKIEAGEPADAEKPQKQGTDWWGEAKGIFWLILAVLGFHSFIAKPFYIPSESMMPVLLKGDRLVVTKFPYGWSFVSPTIPNPAAIVRSIVTGQPEPWGITLPFIDGRLFGSVGNVDVAKALADQGISVDKSQLRLPSGPLKQVGDHPVTVVPPATSGSRA